MIRRRTFSFKNASYATVQMFFYGGSNNSIKICLLFGRITAARLYFPSEITHVLDVDGGGYVCSTNFPHKSTLGKVRYLSEPTNQPESVATYCGKDLFTRTSKFSLPVTRAQGVATNRNMGCH